MISIGKLINLTGQRFERIIVIKQLENNKYGQSQWLCECDCGNKKVIRGYSLTSGDTQSCGCLQKERLSKSKKKYNTYDLSGDYGIGYTSKGEEFYFDLKEYDKIKDYCWSKNKDGYLVTNIKNNIIRLHNFIFDKWADHISGNIIDNRKNNLRIVDDYQNTQNAKLRKDNTSGVKGIDWVEKTQQWKGRIQYKNNRIYLGCYDNIEDAIFIREIAELKLHGEYSRRYLELKEKYKDIDLNSFNFQGR